MAIFFIGVILLKNPDKDGTIYGKYRHVSPEFLFAKITIEPEVQFCLIRRVSILKVAIP
jgi:hypothetical protein